MFNQSPYFEVFKYALMIGGGVGAGLAVVGGLRKIGHQGLTTILFGRDNSPDTKTVSLDDDVPPKDSSDSISVD